MGRPEVSHEKKALFWKARRENHNIQQASEIAGISYSTGRRLNQDMAQQPALPGIKKKMEIPPHPLERHELSREALDCLNDFGRFRARYFGRISSPWQEDAAHQVADLVRSPFKEFVVLNAPPGSGKTTLFTNDIPAWETVKNRALRGLLGAVTQNIAGRYNRRLRNTFARTVPMEADPEELGRGLALDAESVLAADYGPFRPDRSDQIPWSADQFTVTQYGETFSGEKEATWTAFGRDTEVLSHRVNIMVWDDLVTSKRLKTEDMIKEDQLWWHNEVERRLEPYGLLLLQGQRIGAEDLYRHCLDLTILDEDNDDDPEDFNVTELDIPDLEPTSRKKYHHILYKAHYEEYCQKEHRRTARPYDPKNPTDSGCLLDPIRLTWREQNAEKQRPGSTYPVIYQQEDVDPAEVLVPKIWIDGGEDAKGFDHPGCWDPQRPPGMIPQGLDGIKLSIVTVDPAPAKFWSVQWWLYVEPSGVDPLMGQRYLLDMYRGRMDGPDLLDWDVTTSEYTGLLYSWQQRAKTLHFPINYLIVEKNGAQRFLMQYKFFKLWCSNNSVTLRPHDTQQNKTDPKFGVETIKNHYRYGRVRLPGTIAGRVLMAPLVKELTHYPDTPTTDCVMANWFMEYNLQFLIEEDEEIGSVYNDIPSWMNRMTANA